MPQPSYYTSYSSIAKERLKTDFDSLACKSLALSLALSSVSGPWLPVAHMHMKAQVEILLHLRQIMAQNCESYGLWSLETKKMRP